MAKRIKRHILGKTRTFFVSTSPGMERLCFDELLTLGLSMADATITKGGVAFENRVHACYLANLRLRTANRIVMRIETFRSTNFRQLGKKLIGLPWELYLHKDATVTIHVTSRHSRLFHSDAIAERFRKSLAQRWQLADGHGEKKPDISRYPQQIFVRARNDRFTVSIDSSGDLLHKRGLKTHGGTAPIRETLAAAILIVAGYGGNEPLVDPLCGTGTFSFEGAMMANYIPAGWYRNFAFMGWPCFRPSRWKHIRGSAENEIVRRNQPLVCASDKDRHTCRVLEKAVLDNDLTGTVSVFKKDFFDLLPCHIQERTEMEKEGLVVLNPPYGRRLKTKTSSEKIFVEICKKLKKDFTGWKIALIAPNKKLVKNVPFPVATHDFFHGGLNLTLLTGRIR
jgi:putative N6-adenine-specific DNA methylase